MIDNTSLQRSLCDLSLGFTAYHAWAVQARHERLYNIARLLEAASNVKRIRAELAFRKSHLVANCAKNIQQALNGLEPQTVMTGKVTKINSLLYTLLQRASQALSEGRDLRFDELGDLAICTSCGELYEGAGPEACLLCGTVREGFLPFTCNDAMGTRGPHGIMGLLGCAANVIERLFDGLSEEILSVPAGPYNVSLKEMVGHLIAFDEVFRERAWLILETNSPVISDYNPPHLAEAEPYRYKSSEEVLEAFRESRGRTLSLLRGLTNAAWHRVGKHEVYGIIPLTHQGNWIISHERSHLIDMAQMRHNLLIEHNVKQAHELPPQLVPHLPEEE